MKVKPWFLVAALAIALVVAVAAWYWLRPSDSGGRVSVDSPAAESLISPGTTVHGHVEGPGDVRVWVEGINYAVPAVRQGDQWSYTYQGGLSGTLTLAFALQDGRTWSPTVRIEYRFAGDTTASDAGERASDHFPSLVRSIIRPVENALRSIVVLVNEGVARTPRMAGSASHDLDGNGVPDYVQGSPLPPTQGVPYGWIALVVVAVLVCGSVLLVVKGDTWTAYFLRRRHLRNTERAHRAQVQAQQTRTGQEIKLRALQVQADLRQTLIHEQAALRAKALGVQAQQARNLSRLAGQRVAGILDLRRAQLAQGPPRRGFWARLRGR